MRFSLAGYSLLVGGLHALSAHAIPSLSAVGSKLFYPNGTQFYIKGVAYQLTPDDPLVDTAQCERDIAVMSELGANTIRVYHVDASGDHSGCMSAFADAGIYLWVDLDTFDTAIDQTSPHWNETQFDRFKAVLDEFQQYNNTAGVFVGNEVLTTAAGSPAAPYVLAAARDIKAYRDSQGYREIPVGYSAADITELRPMLQNYMACRSNASERLDFFSLNAYEWCGDSSYTESGYDMLEKNATGYPIPIFFSETGCNSVSPRTFTDQAAILGSDMDGTWSGAIIYEWIEETNDYGLISYGPYVSSAAATATNIEDGYTRSGTPTPISPDFTNLMNQWATLTPSGVALSDYTKSTSTITLPSCPAYTSGGWEVHPSSALPTLGQTYNSDAATATTGSSASSGTNTAAAAAATTSSSKSSANAVGAIGVTGADRLMKVSLVLSGLVGVFAWCL
ncbi:hypothetical protein ASPZODRAFT_72069 [Penicilliopsis zonata CBS 506.65]|uniref:1,3-beta-glucanosyltransferase n=1 Tax=Penicilliopsis zonata CBS 506.65 TaxID=1073090 RepID=A0A1L9SAW9_9EURO|nr:hypothetical protein ASPZODRAFT_72069 [Penicilliopsis zonata CBS 506.65]OJJ44323.1 hypothetical protein ASPZODRAFT_72069 [Penicilliopsis zonata CBS 506.65]